MSLGRCLVLNAASQAVSVESVEECLWDIMKGSAFMVEGTGEFCHSPSYEIEIPSVIQQYIYHAPKNATGKPRSLPLTPRNVCARDRYICGYQIEGLCQGRATTIDHIVPTSRWAELAPAGIPDSGPNVWENVVAACRSCNARKGQRTIEELGWTLHTTPWRPSGAMARVLVHSNNPEWYKYLS